jgi:hypothetical protein
LSTTEEGYDQRISQKIEGVKKLGIQEVWNIDGNEEFDEAREVIDILKRRVPKGKSKAR